MKTLLQAPAIYQLWQNLGGFFNARVASIGEYLNLNPGDYVIDIGCGPGYIVDHLDAGIHYVGFDTDKRYIAYAQKHFGHKGEFYCQPFDDDCAQAYGPADVVMMNGVIHHLDDAAAAATMQSITKVLKPEGTFFAVDGCFREGQSWIARWLLRNDRGRYVRTERGYRDLYRSFFEDVTVIVREDLSHVPYTFVIGICHSAHPAQSRRQRSLVKDAKLRGNTRGISG